MTTTISGTTGVSLVQDSTITSTKIVDGTITASDLNGAQTGSAPIYGARAWCTFAGATVGTNAPTAGGNVTSITRNGTGDYTVNFTTALQDGNYSISFACRGTNADYDVYTFMIRGDTAPTTSAFRFTAHSTRAAGLADPTTVFVQVFR